jgi:hypothetical protein
MIMNTQQDIACSATEHQKFELKDDFELLDIMLADSTSQPPLYHPGPY